MRLIVKRLVPVAVTKARLPRFPEIGCRYNRAHTCSWLPARALVPMKSSRRIGAGGMGKVCSSPRHPS